MSNGRYFWTANNGALLERARELCKQHTSVKAVAAAMSQETGRLITENSLDAALRRHPGPSARELLRQNRPPPNSLPKQERPPSEIVDADHLEVVRAVQSKVRTITDLADYLDCSPRRARERADAAIAAGHSLSFNANDEMVFEDAPAGVAQVTGVPMTGDGWVKIGVFSDTHIGSKHCHEDELRGFVEWAHDRGYTRFMIPGDLLEGGLRHHGFEYELSHIGFDDQVDRLLQVLPELPGLEYWYCCGNHEVNSYQKTIGMRPDRAIELRAHAEGRHDLRAVSSLTPAMESAYLALYPEGHEGDPEAVVKVELSHTYDRKAYAISYPLQKHVEAMIPGSKPHVLLKGHLHCHSCMDIRGVVCAQTMCFKGQGSYERARAMSPTIGGMLLDVKHQGRWLDFRHWAKIVRPPPKFWFTPPEK